jgi:predicted ribosome quality control (RQC) complex YloA/Tae2 family protein
MPLDAVFLMALRCELETQLVGMKIDKIQQPEQDQLLLSLRGQGVSSRLLLSAGSGDARAHLTEAAFENPASPPMFCMLLRKHLTGARIRSVTQPPLERSADFTLDCVDALGEPCEKHLILELMGRYSNIILTDEEGRIVDCLRRVDTLMSEKRQVLPGLFYRLPPTQEKLDPLELTKEAFAAAIASAPQDMTADKWLVETFTGLSPLICRELVYRACGETDRRLGELRDKGASLYSAFFALTGDIRSGWFKPVMLLDAAGKPFDFSYAAIMQYGTALLQEQAGSFSALLDAFYTRRFALERMRQRSQTLTKTVRNAADRIQRKLVSQREELKKTAGRERLKELGDILTAQLYRLIKGMSVLRTVDFYDPDGREIDIRLDPLKTPQQNAAKYYKDYTKAKNAEAILSEQIELGERELEYLKSVLEELVRAESERDLTEIRRELAGTGYLRLQSTGKKEKNAEGAPLRFRSSAGLTIVAGRNNVQNETLTHRLAYKTDIWLHAQKVPGSHVVISANGGVPDETTLLEAASLAALYSQARESKKVPVDYTAVKYVKKLPGGRPGMVTYTDYKTIVASPDEALAAKLRDK